MNENTIYVKEQEQGFKGFWHRNKKTVLAIGGVLLAVGAGYVVYKNWGSLKDVFISGDSKPGMIPNPKLTVDIQAQITEALPEKTATVTKIINNGEAIDVNMHIRNLPMGWKASQEKIDKAVELGINLLENQTIVDPYLKNVA